MKKSILGKIVSSLAAAALLCLGSSFKLPAQSVSAAVYPLLTKIACSPYSLILKEGTTVTLKAKLLYVDPTTGQWSPLENRQLQFTFLCTGFNLDHEITAYTDSTGWATVSYQIPGNLLPKVVAAATVDVKVLFNGNSSYLTGRGSIDLTVKK